MSTRWSWFLALESWLAIPFGIAWLTASCCDRAVAQITPDATLPNNSRVSTQDNVNMIEGGTGAGSNLFHSFEKFSVPTGSAAYFNNATDIQNIISRVTGKSVSNIDGLIRANGNANVFLLNPNGIIFGRNATLAIGGSFVATTANAIQFGNQGFFSADNPNASPLLTVNPSAFLFNQIAAAPIQNNSVAPAGLNSSRYDTFGLRVPDGQSLLLVGGNISIDGGGLYAGLNASGGRVELGGLAGAGTVGLNTGNNLSLSFPEGVPRADVSLTNRALANVFAGSGGSIAINARNLDISGDSGLLAGIGRDLGSVDSQAGDIELRAQGAIDIANGFIFNNVESGAVGNAGDINITTGSLSVTNGAQLKSLTRGRGNAGNLEVTSGDLQLDNHAALTATISSGEGGNINLQVRDLILMRLNSSISAEARNNGNGGNITINDPFFVAVPSENSDIVANAFMGRGGNINITTQGIYGLKYRPQLTDFADINASSQFGVNGTVEINTPDVDLSRGLVNLLNVPIDTNFFQACQPGGSQNQSELVVNGRGGLPPNPGETINTDAVQVNFITFNPEVARPSTTAVSPRQTSPKPAPIVEAQGWVIDANGNVVLKAFAPTLAPHNSWQKTADCRAFTQQQRR